jgi:minor extracellular serine protease Vpr
MKRKTMKRITSLFLIYILLAAAISAQIKTPKLPDLSKGRGAGSRGGDLEKLSPELRLLYAQYKSGARGGERISMNYSAAQLADIFSIADVNARNPLISVAVTSASGRTDIAALKKAGMKVYMRLGETIYGKLPIMSLGDVSENRSITAIEAIKSVSAPKPPKDKIPAVMETNSPRSKSLERQPNAPAKVTLANEFNRGTLTGKNVIVGVIDTGIDWRHPAFLKPDGTSRIVAIWDMKDDSFRSAGVGISPPTLVAGGDPLEGTIYTREQINGALKGDGTVNTGDTFGHGTAVAGTAAGNPPKMIGRFSTAKYGGVAPEADLIVVRASDCGGFSGDYIYGAAWMIETAKKMNRPIVINQSFGGHYSAHDGTEVEEKILNQLTGKNIPGVIFTVSAGNEGEYNLHASGVYGARRPGQEDIRSSPVITTVLGSTMMLGVFDKRDDWGVKVISLQSPMTDDDDKQISFDIYKKDGQMQYQLGAGLKEPGWFKRYVETVLAMTEFGAQHNRGTDWLHLNLYPGVYVIYGYGATARVANGNYNFYFPDFSSGFFGTSTQKAGMVGSPGNAANVITVGAYNFRRDWLNSVGSSTFFNFAIGDISGYSSPGGRRKADSVVKPDIVAPATYTISPLSSFVSDQSCINPDSGEADNMLMRPNIENYLTPDGKHLAWEGTSASAPFAAGVIALMLQKNPRLDAEQVRQILIKSARKGGNVGAVPNPAWGWGMLDAEAAIKNTPPVGAKKSS